MPGTGGGTAGVHIWISQLHGPSMMSSAHPRLMKGCPGQQGREAVVVVVVRYTFCGVKSDSNSICSSATRIIQGRKIAMDLIFGSKYLEVQYTSRA